jgi:hypothetical protein
MGWQTSERAGGRCRFFVEEQNMAQGLIYSHCDFYLLATVFLHLWFHEARGELPYCAIHALSAYAPQEARGTLGRGAR